MKIDHIALYVNDLEQSKRFFENYFDAASSEKYCNASTGFESYFLSLIGDCRLEIMTNPNMKQREKDVRDIGLIHVAINVGGKEKVDSLTKSLAEDGYVVLSGPRTTGDGYYESCILDGEYNQIEITG